MGPENVHHFTADCSKIAVISVILNNYFLQENSGLPKNKVVKTGQMIKML